jgi:hypothetical protein
MSEKSISFKGNVSGFIKASLNESSVVVLKARVTSVRLGGVQLERVVSIQYNENENLNFKNINVGDVIVIKGGYLATVAIPPIITNKISDLDIFSK